VQTFGFRKKKTPLAEKTSGAPSKRNSEPSTARKGENERVGKRRKVEKVRAKLRRKLGLRESRSERGPFDDFESTLRRAETSP